MTTETMGWGVVADVAVLVEGGGVEPAGLDVGLQALDLGVWGA